ncbi:glycogen synthase [uncultured Nonlabens sp.]|uniref:glycogen synthase n=1 Tax=uncultured Nonlabens sp. TaxID=859306 RepID=UPI002615472A|nr:glycogen/starch synthase [uncultured Nonlabens sp.]
MNIVHLSAECYPVAKVGGLADVVGALPKYQNGLGHEACVIMPFYDLSFTQKNKFKCTYKGSLKLGSSSYRYSVMEPVDLNLGFQLYLIKIPDLLFTNYVYSDDDAKRFLAFQIACLNWLASKEQLPDVIHCHDHHTGLIPFMAQYCHEYEVFEKTPSILSIHNAQYQGWFSHKLIDLIPQFDRKHTGLLDWDGSINPLGCAIKCAWRVNTVSPSYMEELKQEANGLEILLTHEAAKCVGILNGIDTTVWDTNTDSFLKKNYSKSSVLSGKKANKKWLCTTYNLDVKKPLFAFIGRLVYEKGSDLFPEAFEQILQDQEVSILLLGSGDKNTQQRLVELKKKYEGSYNLYVGYDEALSHVIYAGADFLLMPSRVEPCGLNQMYSLRYGTIPIVRGTGGLKDTIVDIENDGFGFIHLEATAAHIFSTVKRAVTLYKDQKRFKKIRKQIMNIDHSWDKSASTYIQLYKSLTNRS